ncbi:MAG: hypothetical protein D6753_09990 [Planctomycetota bacterium]|nr:MAG: hypothetical protein D6753_09990 [Planctomycetota bacterium]
MRSAIGTAAGGIVGFGILRMVYPAFEYEAMGELPIEPTVEQMRQFTQAHRDYYMMNNAVGLAVIGASIAIAFACVTARRKRIASAALAGILGGVVGAVAGYFTGLPIADAMVLSKDQSLVQASLLHFSFWGGLGLCMAAAVGGIQGGARTMAQAAVAGLLGGILSVVLYTIVASVVFPAANLIHTLPETAGHQALWVLVSSLVLGAAIGKLAEPPTSKQEVQEGSQSPEEMSSELQNDGTEK